MSQLVVTVRISREGIIISETIVIFSEPLAYRVYHTLARFLARVAGKKGGIGRCSTMSK